MMSLLLARRDHLPCLEHIHSGYYFNSIRGKIRSEKTEQSASSQWTPTWRRRPKPYNIWDELGACRGTQAIASIGSQQEEAARRGRDSGSPTLNAETRSCSVTWQRLDSLWKAAAEGFLGSPALWHASCVGEQWAIHERTPNWQFITPHCSSCHNCFSFVHAIVWRYCYTVHEMKE